MKLNKANIYFFTKPEGFSLDKLKELFIDCYNNSNDYIKDTHYFQTGAEFVDWVINVS